MKEIRLNAGHSLREVARQLGVSPSFVSQIENGKSQTSVATLFGFAKLLEVPMDALFESEWNGSTTTSTKATPEIINSDEANRPHSVWGDSQARISTVNPSNRSLITTESGYALEGEVKVVIGVCALVRRSERLENGEVVLT